VTYDPTQISTSAMTQAINTQTYYQASISTQPAGQPGSNGQSSPADTIGVAPLASFATLGAALLLAAVDVVRQRRRAQRVPEQQQ
jgi:hypothetical protein